MKPSIAILILLLCNWYLIFLNSQALGREFFSSKISISERPQRLTGMLALRNGNILIWNSVTLSKSLT
jgi:hypothetical protein